MRKFFTLILAGIAAVACGNRTQRPAAAQPTIVEPRYYGYTVRQSYPHSTESYTQGLQFVDGKLLEGTGQNGKSVLQETDLATGRTRIIARLKPSEFGEGITRLNGEIFQLTWTSNTVHVYDAATGRETRSARYAGEGWGLTTDGEKLYMSNGSATIYRIDPATFRREGSVTVTCKGEPLELLNELEWINGKIWANIYTTDWIAVIDPATGVVEGLVDLRGLLPEEERTPETDVLNGIAWDAATGRIFVTGKNWSRIFEIEINER